MAGSRFNGERGEPKVAKRRWLRLEATWDESEWLEELQERSGVAVLLWPRLLSYTKLRGVGGRVKARSAAQIARKWNVPEKDVALLLAAAQGDGAIEVDGDEWVFTGWTKYNPSDRTGAERQRRFRERNAPTDDITQGSAVTHDVTVRNGVTDRYPSRATGTETETNREQNPDADASGREAPDLKDGEHRAEARRLILALWTDQYDRKNPPPFQDGPDDKPWSLGREFSIWTQLTARDPPEVVNRAIAVLAGRMGGKPGSLRMVNSRKAESRGLWQQCLQQARKQESKGTKVSDILNGRRPAA